MTADDKLTVKQNAEPQLFETRFAMPFEDRLSSEINSGVNYLEKSFDLESGFQSYIASDRQFTRRKESPPEIFSSLILSQCLIDMGIRPAFFRHIPKIIKRATNSRGFIHFFFDKELLVADVDCTAVGYAVLLALGKMPASASTAVDRLIANTNDSGIIEVYEKPAGEHGGRVDTCVVVNVLYLLHALGREEEAIASENLVFDVLSQRTYLHGTRYYPSPDVFLYFLSRVVRDYPKAKKRFGLLLLNELRERQDLPGTLLESALRYAALDNIGKRVSKRHLKRILSSQSAAGDWPACTVFKYGKSDRFFGGEALSTGIALRAIFPTPSASAHYTPPCR